MVKSVGTELVLELCLLAGVGGKEVLLSEDDMMKKPKMYTIKVSEISIYSRPFICNIHRTIISEAFLITKSI